MGAHVANQPVLLLALLATQAAAADVWPMPKWPTAKPAEVGLDAARLAQAREYALSGGGAGYVTRGGKLVMSWGDAKKRFDLKSTTKSIGVTALGLAVGDGKLALGDLARKRHPSFGVPPESNSASGWLDTITLAHLATQTAGFEKPGGYGKLLFEPGTKWLPERNPLRTTPPALSRWNCGSTNELASSILFRSRKTERNRLRNCD
jgi:CubicO group peptidase (beta-lactamase class C family)